MSHVLSEETHRNMLARIPHCTGREVSDWLRTVDEGPALFRFEEKVSWLRARTQPRVRPRQGDHPRVRPEEGRAQTPLGAHDDDRAPRDTRGPRSEPGALRTLTDRRPA